MTRQDPLLKTLTKLQVNKELCSLRFCLANSVDYTNKEKGERHNVLVNS